MNGRSFARLGPEERDLVLRGLFRPFPHPERERAPWRPGRLTSRNVARLLDSGPRALLRHHVMREILGWYYATPRGWAVVGWSDFPGTPRPE
jgi:hypothetical protein